MKYKNISNIIMKGTDEMIKVSNIFLRIRKINKYIKILALNLRIKNVMP